MSAPSRRREDGGRGSTVLDPDALRCPTRSGGNPASRPPNLPHAGRTWPSLLSRHHARHHSASRRIAFQPRRDARRLVIVRRQCDRHAPCADIVRIPRVGAVGDRGQSGQRGRRRLTARPRVTQNAITLAITSTRRGPAPNPRPRASSSAQHPSAASRPRVAFTPAASAAGQQLPREQPLVRRRRKALAAGLAPSRAPRARNPAAGLRYAGIAITPRKYPR